jgi:uncharacterized membrane protein
MTIQRSINLAIVAFIVTLGLALTSLTYVVSAQEEAETTEAVPVTTSEEATESTEEPAPEETEEATSEESSTYNYVAQPGDSYSLMARKATQTYGINNSVNLSGAQIIFVETNLTNLAGSPELNLGQNVEISESVVSEWVQKAQELSEEQIAEWEVYVPGADFNTDSVGESQE